MYCVAQTIRYFAQSIIYRSVSFCMTIFGHDTAHVKLSVQTRTYFAANLTMHKRTKTYIHTYMYIVQKRLVNIKTKICSFALLTSWILRQVILTEMRLINISKH